MKIEVLKNDFEEYTILLDGGFFRHCKTYSELATTIGFLVKSKFRNNAEGFI
ncbi:MAG: hypothetical protein KJ949_00085 [Nanoarchaeota archaeon]|nr:hypothetical protein [Nanoarchaeota archaeon]MBU4308860.1 hypothetical protein [Nanoarchaeota archaeon]